MKGENPFPTRAQMLRLIKSGRAAIEHRLIRAIVLPVDRQDNDAEADQVKALLQSYNETMSVYETPTTSNSDKTK